MAAHGGYAKGSELAASGRAGGDVRWCRCWYWDWVAIRGGRREEERKEKDNSWGFHNELSLMLLVQENVPERLEVKKVLTVVSGSAYRPLGRIS